jgi:chromate transporter
MRDHGVADRPSRASALRELALLFLQLGTTGFGGPAAHIAMMEHEVVRRRGWLDRREFLDLLAATNLIPGPNSTEMAIHIGRQRAGWPGLLVSGGCFILPASLLTLFLAWAYVRFGSLPVAGWALYGVKPVIIAVVLQALWSLTRTAVKSRRLLALAAVATVACFAGVNELLVLLLSGAVMLVLPGRASRRAAPAGPPAALPLGGAAAAGAVASVSATAPAGAAAFGLMPLFLFFLKIGAILFGSGYVLLAFLRADLVERWHWLTQAQLLDAIAVGQVTPGPVFTAATFVGYVLGQTPGAIVATVGIFLPAFVFVALSGLLLPRLRRSPSAAAFLDGVQVASLALMAAVTWHLGRAAIVDPLAGFLAVAGAVALFRLRANTAWLVLAGALAGVLAHGAG